MSDSFANKVIDSLKEELHAANIERLRRAREAMRDSHSSDRYAKTLEDRGWTLNRESPLWRHPLSDEPQGTYSAISIEQRNDLIELLAAIDAVLEMEGTEHGT